MGGDAERVNERRWQYPGQTTLARVPTVVRLRRIGPFVAAYAWIVVRRSETRTHRELRGGKRWSIHPPSFLATNIIRNTQTMRES